MSEIHAFCLELCGVQMQAAVPQGCAYNFATFLFVFLELFCHANS